MHSDETRLFELLDQLDADAGTVVTSVRQPVMLRDAVRVAVGLGMDTSVNDAALQAVRDRVEAFAQRLALESHYERHPDARPSLTELAMAAVQLDDDPLVAEPELLARAAAEVVGVKPAATSDDVRLYAAALRSRASA